LGKFGQILSKIWTKVIKILSSLIRFGQNRNLTSPKTFDLLRLCLLCTVREKLYVRFPDDATTNKQRSYAPANKQTNKHFVLLKQILIYLRERNEISMIHSIVGIYKMIQ